MDEGAWKRLVKRYANGRTICNCGHAYYMGPHEETYTDWLGERRTRAGHPQSCRSGCQANQYATKLEIATNVEAELLKDQAHAA
jgi:hypothetical protein